MSQNAARACAARTTCSSRPPGVGGAGSAAPPASRSLAGLSSIFTCRDGEMQIQFYYRILIIDILIQFATFLYIQNYYG
eukprot:SAG11_NODE_17938_length_504_cov_6.982716_1_plen_78_part_01